MSVHHSWQPIYDKDGKCIGRREFFVGRPDPLLKTNRPPLRQDSALVTAAWIIGVFAVVCFIGAGWEWVEKEDLEWVVVLTGLGVTVLVAAVFYRRFFYRALIGFIRFVRMSFRRIEEESRPKPVKDLVRPQVQRQSSSACSDDIRESESAKCLAADIDDLGSYDQGTCGLKCNGEWAELEPGWEEGLDFDCAYDGRWTKCPHYCGPRV